MAFNKWPSRITGIEKINTPPGISKIFENIVSLPALFEIRFKKGIKIFRKRRFYAVRKILKGKT